MISYIKNTLPNRKEFTSEEQIKIKKIIEDLRNGNSIKESDVGLLLCFINNKARKQLQKLTGEGPNSDFKELCGVSQVISMEMYEKLCLSVNYCNVGSCCFDEKKPKIRHAFGIVSIPVEGNKTKKYLIDLTFKQFCTSRNCSEDKYTRPSTMGRTAAPDPGYFLNQSKEGQEIINQLLEFGFIELTEEVAKLYCDAFVLSTRDLEFYGGKIPTSSQLSTNTTGESYLKEMENNEEKADIQDELEDWYL